jgi:hypothetical protein
MHSSPRILLLLAAAPILIPLPAVAEMHLVSGSSTLEAAIPRPDGVLLIGGTGGGMTAGGMNGGMTAGGMNGGMTTGGMNGGMTTGGMDGGMVGAGVGGTSGGLPGYSGSPAGGIGQNYGGDAMINGGSQPTQNYQCVTQQGHCSVASLPGSLRHGASCTCLLGGAGKIK